MKVRYIFIHIYIYIYIYIVEKYIQLYIVYDIQEPLGILLKWEHNVYLSSSKEVEVVSLGCWAEQPQLCSSSLFGECHFLYSPESESEWLEGRPLWERTVYTALHGARLSSVPSGDQSANPASVPGRSGLQGAFLSVSSAQKCSGAGRLATPSGVSRAARSAVPCRPPFQGTELAALSTPEASLERLVPLVSHLAVWEPLPSVSYWDLPEQTLVPSLP